MQRTIVVFIDDLPCESEILVFKYRIFAAFDPGTEVGSDAFLGLGAPNAFN